MACDFHHMCVLEVRQPYQCWMVTISDSNQLMVVRVQIFALVGIIEEPNARL